MDENENYLTIQKVTIVFSSVFVSNVWKDTNYYAKFYMISNLHYLILHLAREPTKPSHTGELNHRFYISFSCHFNLQLFPSCIKL